MPPDAATAATNAPNSPSDPAAIVKTHGAENGWHFEEEQSQPKFVPRQALVKELADAGKNGNLVFGTVDEVIEECSSAGGTHILLKTKDGLVHLGGHGTRIGPDPSKGQHYVIGIDKLAAPESIEKKTWCVPARSIYAKAKVLIGVKTDESGEQMIRELSK